MTADALDLGELRHGVSVWPGDGRWVAFCRYHGLRAAGPVEQFARDAWSRHLSRECIVPTIEDRSSQVTDYEGNLTGYFVPIELWREVRTLLRNADALTRGAQRPASTEVAPESTRGADGGHR